MKLLHSLILCLLPVAILSADHSAPVNVLHSQIISLATFKALHMNYSETHEEYLRKARVHHVEEFNDDESYLVRETVYKEGEKQFYRMIIGNETNCFQFLQKDHEHSCHYAPEGTTTTLANVISFIAEGFQQGQVEFDSINPMNTAEVLHWKLAPMEGDYLFAFSTQTHIPNQPVQQIVAISKTTGLRITYSDIKIDVNPQIPSTMFQPPAPCLYPQTVPENTFGY